MVAYTWTPEADRCILTQFVEMHNEGTFVATNGWKPGYLKALEEKMAIVMPHENIKADPHIISRLKTMKKNYFIVHDMIYGATTTGFGWNSDTKCIVAEPSVWNAYPASHKNASPFRNKALPFFEMMCIVFGHDRATGANAESAADVVEDLEEESITHGDSGAYLPEIDWMNDADFLSHMAYAGVPGSSDTYAFPVETPTYEDDPSPTTKKAKKKSTTPQMIEAIHDLGESVRDIVTEIGRELSSAIRDEVRVENKVGELRKEFFKEVLALDGLTPKQSTTTCRAMGSDESLMNLFFAISQETRLDFVRDIIGE